MAKRGNHLKIGMIAKKKGKREGSRYKKERERREVEIEWIK